MRTRRQAEGVGACVPVCESAYYLLLVISDLVIDPWFTPRRQSLSIYPARAAARAALELRRAPHFDVGH